MNKLEPEHIDFLVAKKIMNWDLAAMGDGVLGWQQWIDASSWTVTPQRIWRPSTNIADAWKVLEHFVWPKCYVRFITTTTGNWRCDIELNGGDGPVMSAFHKDAPMAICLAALKAVGVDVTEFAPSASVGA